MRTTRGRSTATHKRKTLSPINMPSRFLVPWLGRLAIVIGIALVVGIAASQPGASHASPQPSPATTRLDGSLQVQTAVDLDNPLFHPRQLAYDARRDGVWFWTSTQDRDVAFDNRIFFFDIPQRHLQSWPLPSNDWSSQVHAGLAVAPNGDVWVGWNHNLVAFHPADGSYALFALPAQPRYPLPAAVLGNLPADLGITDLAVARDGTVWIARYAALSLTTFTPSTHSFREYPLPSSAGDPAKLAIGPDGHIVFTTNFSADHPGYLAENVGEYDPRQGKAVVYRQGAQSLAMAPDGDIYTVLDVHGASLSRLRATERAAATSGHVPAFEHSTQPFDSDDRALAVDSTGRVWTAVAGQPAVAVYDPATGQTLQYRYPTAVQTNSHTRSDDLDHPYVPAPGAYWLSHIVAMTTDSQGHLWYVREGLDQIEEVTA